MFLLLDVMDTLVHDPFIDAMPAFFSMTFAEMMAAKHPTAWVEFEHGQLDEAAFAARFFADGRGFDVAAFKAHVGPAYRLLPGIEPLLEELATAKVPMHTLSNYPCWFELVEQHVQLSRWVRWTFVSCRTGLRKPDPRAYLDAAATLGVAPAECLFVDDRRRNVEAARGVGMDAVLFEGAPGLREALVERGLLPSLR